MPDYQKVNNSLDRVIQALIDFKQALNENVDNGVNIISQSTPVLTKNASPTTNVPTVNSVPAENFDSFESLKRALQSDKWPEAVNPNLICQPDNESDKLERGRGIIELMIEEDLKGLKVLDIGCGEGQCAYIASEYQPNIIVGYDIVQNDKWADYKKDNLVYTTEFQDVVDRGPYDVIVIFDVVDHAKGMTPTEILRKAKEVLADNGKIYLRTHPFVSRHATHLYHDLNKAYVHLVFTADELKQIVPESKWAEENVGVIYPIKTYNDMIAEAGLSVLSRRDITEKVEPFFKIPKIAERIMQTTKTNSYPEFQMSVQFIDYVLKKW